MSLHSVIKRFNINAIILSMIKEAMEHYVENDSFYGFDSKFEKIVDGEIISIEFSSSRREEIILLEVIVKQDEDVTFDVAYEAEYEQLKKLYKQIAMQPLKQLRAGKKY